MADFIILAFIAVCVIAAGRYVYKAKKSGNKCIGCSMASCCSGKNSGCCGQTETNIEKRG